MRMFFIVSVILIFLAFLLGVDSQPTKVDSRDHAASWFNKVPSRRVPNGNSYTPVTSWNEWEQIGAI
jgi:hypothetical protein